MAYFVEMAQTNASASGTINANMPTHQTDDYLIAYVTVDSGTISLPAGWAALTSAPANPVSNGTITYLAFKKAAGSSETFSGVTVGDAYTCGIYCFRDVDTTTPFDGVTPLNASNGTAAETVTCQSVTTNTADALIVYMCAFDGTTPQAVSNPGVMWIDGFDSTGTTATTSSHQAAAWYIQRAAGASPTATFRCNASNASTRVTFALKNKTSGRIPAYIDDVSSPATMITPAHHTAAIQSVTFTGTLTNTSNVNGKTVAGSTPTLGADFGINPYANAVGRTAAITAATAMNGYEITLTGGRNFSTGLVMGSLIALNPKSATFGLGSVAQGGCAIRFGSGASDWIAYQVAAKDTPITTEQRYVFAIQPGYTGSDYGTPGGSYNNSATTYMQVLMNCPVFASNLYLSELHQVFTQVIAGGDATNPVGIPELVQVGKSFRLPVIQPNGAAGAFSFAPIQIGGGDAVNFQVDAGVLQFPRRYDTAKKEIAYHADDNRVGIYFAGKSGDVIKFTNSLITAPTPYVFEITSGATSAATWDFSGLSVINATVTLRPVMTFTNIAFTDCASVTTTGSSISNCAFDNTTVNVSSPANAALLTDCTFTSGGTGHGLVITGSAANFTLDCSFSGYASSNGTTGNEAVYVNTSAGNVEISYTGGGSQPSIRAAAGVNVTFAATPVTVTVTVKDVNTGAVVQNARVLLEKVSDGTDILTGLTDVNGQVTTSYSYLANTAVTGKVRRASAGYGTLYKTSPISATITASGLDLTVLLIPDE